VVARSLSGRRRSTSRRKTVRCSSTWQSQFVLAGGDDGVPTRKDNLSRRVTHARPGLAARRREGLCPTAVPAPSALHRVAGVRPDSSHPSVSGIDSTQEPSTDRGDATFGDATLFDGGIPKYKIESPARAAPFRGPRAGLRVARYSCNGGVFLGNDRFQLSRKGPSHDARQDDAPPLHVARKYQGASKAKNPVCCSAVLSRESVRTLPRNDGVALPRHGAAECCCGISID
jgi:hypothetical protein